MLLMASAPKEKQACLRGVAPLEEQLKLSPRTKSYSRNTKKEKIQAKRGGLTRGLRLLRNRDSRKTEDEAVTFLVCLRRGTHTD